MKPTTFLSTSLFLAVAVSQSCLAAEIAQAVAAWDKSCPNDKSTDPRGAESFGLAVTAILAPKAAQAAFDAIGAAIKASADTSTVIRASRPVYSKFYKISPLGEVITNQPCLIVRKGVYSESDYTIINKELSLGGLRDKDQMYVELKLEQDPMDPKFLRFRPVFVKIKEFEDSSFWTKDRRVDVQINLKSMYSESLFGSAIITFRGVLKGFEIDNTKSRLNFAASSPFLAPKLDDVEEPLAAQGKKAKNRLAAFSYLAKDGQTNEFEYEKDKTSVYTVDGTRDKLINYCKSLKTSTVDPICSNWELQTPKRDSLLTSLSIAESDKKLKAARIDWAKNNCNTYSKSKGAISCFPDDTAKENYPETGYIVTTASISHTRDASKFGLALANIISSSSEDLAKAAAEQLPQARKTRADTEKASERKQTQDIILTEGKLDFAQRDLNKEIENKANDNEIQKLRLAVVEAMINVNNAYFAAGREPPYSQYE